MGNRPDRADRGGQNTLSWAPAMPAPASKWAQEMIEAQEPQIQEMGKKLREQSNGGGTRVVVNESFTGEGPNLFNAPDDARVRFYMDKADGYRWIDVRLERTKDGWLHVSGSYPLMIRTFAANVLEMQVSR